MTTAPPPSPPLPLSPPAPPVPDAAAEPPSAHADATTASAATIISNVVFIAFSSGVPVSPELVQNTQVGNTRNGVCLTHLGPLGESITVLRRAKRLTPSKETDAIRKRSKCLRAQHSMSTADSGERQRFVAVSSLTRVRLDPARSPGVCSDAMRTSRLSTVALFFTMALALRFAGCCDCDTATTGTASGSASSSTGGACDGKALAGQHCDSDCDCCGKACRPLTQPDGSQTKVCSAGCPVTR
jgi:hypothetical protein